MKAKKIIIQGIIPFFLTMIIVSCLLWVLGTSPFEVFITLLEGSFGTTDKIFRTIVITSVIALASFGFKFINSSPTEQEQRSISN